MSTGTYTTSLPYDQAYSRVVADLTTKGATITQKEPQVIGGHVIHHKRPSIVLGLILCLFFLVPGIIYFIVAGKDRTETFAVEIGQSPGEPTTMRIHGTGKGFYAAMRTMELLPR
jgi:hypothetical protein